MGAKKVDAADATQFSPPQRVLHNKRLKLRQTHSFQDSRTLFPQFEDAIICSNRFESVSRWSSRRCQQAQEQPAEKKYDNLVGARETVVGGTSQQAGR